MSRYAFRRPHLALVRERARRYRPEYGADIDTGPHTDRGPDALDDTLDDLADEIATLAAHIHAATQRLLELIAEFDRLRGWEREGHRSCAHWLAFRTGIGLPTAREKVRAARALTELPRTREAMARGELSFSKVRALTRAATPGNEEDLLELARGATTAQTERMVRAWKKRARAQEADLERELHETRHLSVVPDDEGMYVVRGRLPAEVGALLMRAVEAASDQLFREENPAAPEEDTRKASRQRRADALALIAQRAMAAGFGDESPVSGTRAERYQVVLHVSAETLSEGEEPGRPHPEDGSGASSVASRSHLEDGTRVSAETSRRLSCDAATVRMTHDPEGRIVSVGRRTRRIPPALRRALDARDRGCRFPGCGLRFTDAHHVEHWADGGETSLGNCLLLCRHHHRLVHEEGWTVGWWGEGKPVFHAPDGRTTYDGRWEAPELPGDGVRALLEGNRGRGIEPDGRTASARWKREKDIPDDVYFRALEASA